MAIDTSLGNIDLTKKPQDLELFLAKPDFTIIAKLKSAYNKNNSISLGGMNELSFDIPHEIDIRNQLKKNPDTEKIRDRYLIKAKVGNSEEWYIINNISDSIEDGTEIKNVQAMLLPYELKDKLFRSYDVTSYNATQVLTDALADTIWSVGYVDADFDLKYRSFKADSTTVLDFVIKIAKTFNAVIVWDTSNRKVGLYKPENIGQNRGLHITYGKYLKTLDRESNSDEMVTMFHPYGRDDLSIRRVNPTGTSHIEDFSYFLYPFERDVNKNVIQSSYYMSDGLCNAILDYDEKVKNAKGQFDTHLTNKSTEQDTLTTKENQLSTLQEDKAVINDTIDICQANNNIFDSTVAYSVGDLVIYNDVPYECIQNTTAGILPTDSAYWDNLFTVRKDKQGQIDVKNTEIYSLEVTTSVTAGASVSGDITLAIDGNNVVISVVAGDTTSIVAQKINQAFADLYPSYLSSYSMSTVTTYYYSYKAVEDITISFTDTGATGVTVSLSKVNYGSENKIATIDNDIYTLRNSLSIPNNFTSQQITERNQFIIEKEWVDTNYVDDQDLYDEAVKRFEDIKKPKTVFNIDIVNFLQIVEAQRDWDKLNLGDTITINYEKLNINVTAKIVRVDFDYEDGSVGLTIANVKEIESNDDKLMKILYNSISTSTTVTMSEFKWDGVETAKNDINNIINNTWNTIKSDIDTGVNETVSISRRGLMVKDGNDPLRYLVAQHGVLALTNDGGNTWKHAITPEGIIGERVFGKLIVGNKLLIGDDNGTFEIKGNLLTIKDTNNTVRTQLGEYATGKYGLKLVNKTGTETVLDEDGILQTWQQSEEDNVDSLNRLVIDVYIPDESISIRRVLLRFRLKAFRAYSKGSLGGGSWSDSTVSGSSTISITNTKAFTNPMYNLRTTYDGSHSHSISGGGHQHKYTWQDTLGNYHDDWTSTIDPVATSTGTESDHRHMVEDHGHSVDIQGHSHSFSVPDHTHGIDYGIYKSTSATNVTVVINGTDVTTALGGAFITDQSNLDITSYLVKGWNTVELGSSQLGRLSATIFSQCFIST